MGMRSVLKTLLSSYSYFLLILIIAPSYSYFSLILVITPSYYSSFIHLFQLSLS